MQNYYTDAMFRVVNITCDAHWKWWHRLLLVTLAVYETENCDAEGTRQEKLSKRHCRTLGEFAYGAIRTSHKWNFAKHMHTTDRTYHYII